MRNNFLKLRQESANLLEHKTAISGVEDTSAEAVLRRRGTILANTVGQAEDTGQFGLGKAPRDMRPITKIEISKEKEKEIAAM